MWKLCEGIGDSVQQNGEGRAENESEKTYMMSFGGNLYPMQAYHEFSDCSPVHSCKELVKKADLLFPQSNVRIISAVECSLEWDGRVLNRRNNHVLILESREKLLKEEISGTDLSLSTLLISWRDKDFYTLREQRDKIKGAMDTGTRAPVAANMPADSWMSELRNMNVFLSPLTEKGAKCNTTLTQGVAVATGKWPLRNVECNMITRT